VFGMLFAVAVAWWNLVGEVRGPLRRLADHPGLCWLGAGMLYAVQLLARSPSSQFSRGNPVSEMTVNTVMPLIAALVVAPVVLAPTGGGWIRTALGSRPIASIGTVSYGIYLWHTVVILQVYYWITDGSLPRSATILAVLVVALTAVAAIVSYVVVESPMMRWSARVSRSRFRGAPPSATAVGVSA
jgi:peptidoglycan/LPS O-acetylase OafA/YrhL